jgi:plasmid stabilization system protein ParE
LQGVQVQGLQPLIGRSLEDLPPQYREWVSDFGHGGYVALYQYDEDIDTLTVMAVRHQRGAGY